MKGTLFDVLKSVFGKFAEPFALLAALFCLSALAVGQSIVWEKPLYLINLLAASAKVTGGFTNIVTGAGGTIGTLSARVFGAK